MGGCSVDSMLTVSCAGGQRFKMNDCRGGKEEGIWWLNCGEFDNARAPGISTTMKKSNHRKMPSSLAHSLRMPNTLPPGGQPTAKPDEQIH